MLRNKSVLEVKIGERIYALELANDSPLGEAYDAVTRIRGFIIERINEENEKSKPKNPEPVPLEAA